MSKPGSSPKVLMVCADFPPALSGIGDYAESLSRALVDQGVPVTVLTTANPEAATEERDGARLIARVMRAWGFRDARRLLEEVDRLGDGVVVHIQYPGVAFGRNPMINLLPLALRLLRPRVPVVVTVHDVRVMRRRWKTRLFPMLLGATAVIYVDPPDLEALRGMIPTMGRRMTWIPIASSVRPLPAGPLDIERWRADVGLPGPDPVVAFFGIVYPHKGLLELVEAVGRVRMAGTPARLLVVGGFDRETPFRDEIEAALSPGREAGWVSWLESPALEGVSRCLHAADFAALPYHSGAASNRSSLLAALAHGLPVVTTDGPATPPGFAESFAVTLVPPRDVEALAGAIENLARSGSAPRTDRAPRPPLAVAEWSDIAARTQAVYQQALRGAA